MRGVGKAIPGGNERERNNNGSNNRKTLVGTSVKVLMRRCESIYLEAFLFMRENDAYDLSSLFSDRIDCSSWCGYKGTVGT